MTDRRFQVHLRGLIELLAGHLYSSPEVFLRELLQNAVDAERARQALGLGHAGRVTVEIVAGAPSTLSFIDEGIGLTEDEIHRFLATIGDSGKRGALPSRDDGYLGQFGIGLLSCFVVADDIVVVTRSARDPDGPAWQWRGRADGSYSLDQIQTRMGPGTQVHLRAREGSERFFDPDYVREQLRRFGDLLPVPVEMGGMRVNRGVAPWLAGSSDALDDYCAEALGFRPRQTIRLRSNAGGVDGVAFVLPQAVSLASQPAHRVYLKGMLLAEQADNLLPRWAFFVRCVVVADGLKPTASRESLREGAELDEAREALGRSLRHWLIRLAEHEPAQMRQLVEVHFMAFKALAVDDAEFYELMAPHLPVQTNEGDMTLLEYRERCGGVARYAPTRDAFRQIAPVATAQGVCVVNGGYVHDASLIERLTQFDPDLVVQRIDAGELVATIGTDGGEAGEAFAARATAALSQFACRVEARMFDPADLPALYGIDDDMAWKRNNEGAAGGATSPWSVAAFEVVGDEGEAPPVVCLNLANRLIKRLAELPEGEQFDLGVRLIYVHALMLAHQPLRGAERTAMEQDMLRLLELGLDGGRDAR